MPDLAAQIRATLDAWAGPQPSGIITTDGTLTQAEFDEFAARWKAAHGGTVRRHELAVILPSPFDRMRDALLGVLEVHKPERDSVGAKVWHNCASCRDTGWNGPEVPWPCPTVLAIAEKLGIEVATDVQ